MSVPSPAGGSKGKKHPGTAGGLGGRTGLKTPTRAPHDPKMALAALPVSTSLQVLCQRDLHNRTSF